MKGNSNTKPNPFLRREKAARQTSFATQRDSCPLTGAVVVIDRMTALETNENPEFGQPRTCCVSTECGL